MNHKNELLSGLWVVAKGVDGPWASNYSAI